MRFFGNFKINQILFPTIIIIAILLCQFTTIFSQTLHDKTYLIRPDHNRNLEIKGENYEIEFHTFTYAFMYENQWTEFIDNFQIVCEFTLSWDWWLGIYEKDILDYKRFDKYFDKDNLHVIFKIEDYSSIRYQNRFYFKWVKIRVAVEQVN